MQTNSQTRRELRSLSNGIGTVRRTRFHANRGSLTCGGWCECLNARPQAASEGTTPSTSKRIAQCSYRDVRSQRAACELSTQTNDLDKYLRIAAPRRKFSVKNENRTGGLSLGLCSSFSRRFRVGCILTLGKQQVATQQQQRRRVFIQFSSDTLAEWRGAGSSSLITFSLRRRAPSGRIALHFIQSLHRISSSYADKLYASSPALTPDRR